MIRGKAVDDVQALPEGILVLLGAEHRPHLSSPLANPWDVILTKEEVMRTHLASDGQPLLLGNTDYRNLEEKIVATHSQQINSRRSC